jgi:hypothetical protein
LHFPHISNNWHIVVSGAEAIPPPRVHRDLAARFATRTSLAFPTIPPCVIFAISLLQKMQNASKSRTVKSKSGTGERCDILHEPTGAGGGHSATDERSGQNGNATSAGAAEAARDARAKEIAIRGGLE